MKFDTMMKAASTLVLGAGLLLATAQSALADGPQTTGQLSRAEVHSQLVALQSMGYDWAANDNYYPQNIQAAERRLAEHDVQRQASVSAQDDQ